LANLFLLFTLWAHACYGCAMRRTSRKSSLPPLAIAALLHLGACRGSAEADASALLLHNRPLQLQAMAPPQVAWDADRAVTDVVVHYVARLADGTPLQPGEVTVQMLLDGAPLDQESILQARAAVQQVNLVYSMVLDATRSMLLHTPPAFEPMKQAAQQSVRSGQQMWQKRSGQFVWAVTWFDDYVYRPANNWPDDALLSISPPAADSFTRLYSAVDFALDDLPRLRHEAGLDAAHAVLVVFTDGHDNHPAWNPAFNDEVVQPDSGWAYHKISWPTVSHAALLEKIRSRPDLTVHAIGMGNDIDEAALQALAQAGRGIYLNNARGASIDSLFARVTKEFTTLVSTGATIPNAPGDYDFTLVVTTKRGRGSAKLHLRLHAGDATATVLQGGPAPTP
jgi:hypothetical protein